MSQEGELDAYSHHEDGASSAFDPSTPSTPTFSKGPEQRCCRSLRLMGINCGQLMNLHQKGGHPGDGRLPSQHLQSLLLPPTG